MSDGTAIEWSDATWNPVRASRWAEGVEKIGWHCEHASPGCVNCYAERINRRLGTGRDFKPVHLEHVTRDGRPSGDVKVFLDEEMLLRPLRWQRARLIFPCSMTDLFADFVTDAMLDKVFAIAMLARRHTFQVLTKRAARMRAYWSAPDRLYRLWMAAGAITAQALQREDLHGADISRQHWNLAAKEGITLPLRNVWSGVSVEDQTRADERLPDLVATPAVVRWVSFEPLIERVDVGRWLWTCCGNFQRGSEADGQLGGVCCSLPVPTGDLDWGVTGGESGPRARPSNPQWFRDLGAQLEAAGVAWLHKQNGEYASVSEVPGPGAHHTFDDGRTVRRVGKKAAGRLLDGVQHDGYPEARHG